MELIQLEESPIILITGIMAVGKSTVAQRLAERLQRSVHLRGDLFRRMIVNGQAPMDLELSAEGYAQLWLRYRLAISAAKQYRAAGFTVVYQDIVIGKELAEVIDLLKDATRHNATRRSSGMESGGIFAREPLHVIVLCPTPDAVAMREEGRNKTGYSPDFTVADFDRQFRAETPRVGLWLDSSALSVDETVEMILANLERARIGG